MEAHLRETGETYWEHGWQALKIAGVMGLGAAAAVVHAVAPSLCPRLASSCAAWVVDNVAARRRASSSSSSHHTD